jgi:hypothetical protein
MDLPPRNGMVGSPSPVAFGFYDQRAAKRFVLSSLALTVFVFSSLPSQSR